MRDDVDTELAEVLVAARVVAVDVRVDEHADRLVGQRLDRGQQLLRQRRELIVDHQHAVIADQEPDVAALPFEVMDVAGHLVRFDLHRGEIRLGSLSPRGTGGEQSNG